MKSIKERAARSNRATHARTSDSLPACGSRSPSITRRRRRAKYQIRRLFAVLVLAAVVVSLVVVLAALIAPDKPEASGVPQEPQLPADGGPFYDEVTDPTFTGYPEATAAPRYELTDIERDTVERVVMAEAGGECYEGQMLVAQCILNAAEKLDQRPPEVFETLSYAGSRPDPTQSVRDAVAAVFDDGEIYINEPILYFYAPARTTSEWHESQIFVIELGGHRFFKERSPEQ